MAAMGWGRAQHQSWMATGDCRDNCVTCRVPLPLTVPEREPGRSGLVATFSALYIHHLTSPGINFPRAELC